MPKPDAHPSWNKIAVLENVMAACDEKDWILWLDADVLILDYSRKLESLIDDSKSILFSTDKEGLCMGFFLVRNTARIRAFLAGLWQFYTESWPWEQTAVKKLLGADSAFGWDVGFISESIVQNPHSLFSPDAFAMHYWAHHGGRDLVSFRMKQALDKGWNMNVFNGTV
jgi:hypothetical protein